MDSLSVGERSKDLLVCENERGVKRLAEMEGQYTQQLTVFSRRQFHDSFVGVAIQEDPSKYAIVDIDENATSPLHSHQVSHLHAHRVE